MQHIPSTALRDARLELHYAAQVVAACADAWLPIRADDGHTAMEWERPRMIGALSPSGIAIGVDVEAFAIIGFDARRQDVSFPLAGKTLVQALLWADSRYGTPRGAHLRDYDLPVSPLRTGATFAGYPEQLAELARWYQLGHEVVAAVSPVEGIRIWPHHFDLGAIVDGVGVGLSPGDRYYDEPYFYVTPRTGDTRVPALPAGTWRTDEWSGAVLTSTEVGDDAAKAREFVAAALVALR